VERNACAGESFQGGFITGFDSAETELDGEAKCFHFASINTLTMKQDIRT